MRIHVRRFGNRVWCLHNVGLRANARMCVCVCVFVLGTQRVATHIDVGACAWRTWTNGFYLFTIYKLKLNSVWWFVTCKFIFYRFFCRSPAAFVRHHYVSYMHIFVSICLPVFLLIFFPSSSVYLFFSPSLVDRTFEIACEIAFSRLVCRIGRSSGERARTKVTFIYSFVRFIFRIQATEYPSQRQHDM